MSNRLRLLAGPRAAWSPHRLTRSVWRASWDSGIGVSNPAGVDSWTDYIGGLAPEQATEGARPALDESGDYPVVSAAAGSRYLTRFTLGTGFIPTGTDTSVIFAVVQGWTTGNILCWGGTSAASTRRIGLDGAGNVTLAVGSSGNGHFVTVPASLVARSLLTGITTADGLSFRINGVEVGRKTIAMPTTGTNLIRLFANTNGTPGALGDGAIADLNITTALSDADILRFEGWLAHKRNIFLGSVPS